MKSRFFAVGASAALLVSAALFAADEIKLDKIHCVVAAKNPAKAANAVAYKGGNVYFCCENCPKEFSKDPTKFAVSANTQLAATGQAKQLSCPYTGEKLADGTEVKVGGVDVKFCCMDCKGNTAKAEPAKAIEMVFNDKAFDKAFKVAAKK
jgi:YHS domain-containing protein